MEKVSAVYTVSVDISESDVPTLMVSEIVFEDNNPFLPSPKKVVLNTIQGKTAEQLYKYLTGKLDTRFIDEQALLTRMKGMCPINGDEEMNHIYADEILCDFLNALGYDELLDYYTHLKKYYS